MQDSSSNKLKDLNHNSKGENMFLFFIYSVFTLILFVNKFNSLNYNLEVLLFIVLLVFAISYNTSIYLSAIFFGISLNAIIGSSFLVLLPNFLVITQMFILVIELSRNEFKFKLTNNFKIFILLFLYSFIVGIVNIENPMQLISFNQYYLAILCSILIIILIDKDYAKKYLENSLLAASVIASIFYIVLYSMGYSLVDRTGNGFLIPDRNYMSLFLSFGISVIFGRFLNLSFKQKQLYIIMLIILLFGQLVLASRGGLIATVVVLLYTIIKSGDFKSKAGLVFMISILAFVIFKYSSSFEIFDRFGDDTLETGGGRTDIWENTFDAYMKQDMSLIIWGGGYNHTFFNLSDGFSTHNNYLEQMYDYGIIGAIIMLVLFIKCFIDGDLIQRLIVLCFLTGFFSLVPLMYLEYWVVIGYLMIPRTKET